MYACSVRPTVTYGYKGFIHSIVYSCVKDRQTDRHTNIEEAESDIKSRQTLSRQTFYKAVEL